MGAMARDSNTRNSILWQAVTNFPLHLGISFIIQIGAWSRCKEVEEHRKRKIEGEGEIALGMGRMFLLLLLQPLVACKLLERIAALMSGPNGVRTKKFFYCLSAQDRHPEERKWGAGLRETLNSAGGGG
jgi:hypothetical protein